MCARRGTPLHVYSDNGTNFVGASRVLQREYKQALQTINTDILENISQLGVTWHFNVAAWSSAGGIWEAAVKSLKHHLKRVVGHQKLTFEEYSTLLTQIEACLNSRPLCSLTENPEDIDYLSPGHFLIGGPILSEPLSDINIENVKTRWQLTEKIYKEFWKRWSAEYLHTLQTRSKWHIPQKNIELDSIVVMKEDNLPPSNWALAKVIDVHPGKDGYVRAVTLKTKHGVLKRPITKLCPLPVLPDQDEKPLRADSDPGATGHTSKRSRSKPNYLICLLLLIIAIISPSMQQTYKITQLESTKALYFDRAADLQLIERHWIIIVYYNMSTFWKNIQKVERYLNHLYNICNEEGTCTATLAQFRHELDEIEHYNNMLKFAPHSRARRGLINGVGRLSNYLFGILDDQFAEKYSKDIKLIHQNEVYLQKLLKNQTTIIEAENNIIQRNEYIMNKQFTRIEKQIKNFSTEVQQVKQRAINTFYFTTHVVTLDVILSNLRRIQDTLINTVTNIYHGRLDVHLLSPAQLQEQLNVISRHVQGEFLVPVNVQNIKELFKMLQVKARITEDYVIIEVKVPLLSTDTYELNRVIPIPQTRNLNSIYVIPSTDYIAFNLRKDTFMSVMENDLQLCIRYNDVNLLCPITSPLYELKVGQSICDVKMITDDSNHIVVEKQRSAPTDGLNYTLVTPGCTHAAKNARSAYYARPGWRREVCAAAALSV
ncbi:unnamed protein product [Parnassius apollo]|uniref:(apollo) hypothetical protein n=1 Tax=Parnassius apollo TaxID=110799 RepID=A0A8S3WUD8_PARAO|nr:unnamed protein product [Parnassius apollo]